MESQQPNGNADGSNHLHSDERESVSFIGHFLDIKPINQIT